MVRPSKKIRAVRKRVSKAKTKRKAKKLKRKRKIRRKKQAIASKKEAAKARVKKKTDPVTQEARATKKEAVKLKRQLVGTRSKSSGQNRGGGTPRQVTDRFAAADPRERQERQPSPNNTSENPGLFTTLQDIGREAKLAGAEAQDAVEDVQEAFDDGALDMSVGTSSPDGELTDLDFDADEFDVEM